MSRIFSAIACNLDTHILQASVPLFEMEKVEAIEWSFDSLFKVETIPEWFTDLVKEFSDHNRLIGHGVYFSLFSGKWSPEQQNWLSQLRKLSGEFHFDHISEHFGFMTGSDFHKGAPLGIPFNKSTLAIGRDRLARIQEACNCPVGLENLAFSYSYEEVKKHGDFLNQLVESINGFIILDLHNLYCQCHNFDIDFQEMLSCYPLDRVREIHISGGSWDNGSEERTVRRDTHDDSVPETVFEYLEKALPRCQNLKFVVMEQLGTALDTVEKQIAFQHDFVKMDGIVKSFDGDPGSNQTNSFLPFGKHPLDMQPVEDIALASQQMQLSAILETAVNLDHAREMLNASDLKHSDWHIEQWQPHMLKTAIDIAQKWKGGF
ncbi:hypothetical protein DYBT9623_03015 [Dyadobacter sp. CECT 9623]|uniref:DUF692 family protein n=1 Tax=Dyadobacter linearis TaxID=2823330 RepID=A0ABN7R8B9_9BACT|nr:DUF692 family multinuclear iron-containing protein [Dyadobacter sp. CECT 9623]CAG5070469.1 hypothetical protein DYBT9623_03015 [Dyadobacter sp. CECT 9623]